MATGDRLRRHRWSGDHLWQSYLVRGDHTYSNIILTDGPGDPFWGTICGMTDPVLRVGRRET